MWAFFAFLALGQWKWKFTHPDGGVRIISGRIAFVLTTSLIFTTMMDVHKLHLLWACPLLIIGAQVITAAIWEDKANRLISHLRAKSERTGQSMADMLHEELTGQQRFQEPNTFLSSKALACLGIIAYILSVLSTATDLDGNSVAPIPLVGMAAIALIVFLFWATIRLWHEDRDVSLLLATLSLMVLLCEIAQSLTLPEYGSPLIILTNIITVIWLVAYIIAIITLFKTNQPKEDFRNSLLAVRVAGQQRFQEPNTFQLKSVETNRDPEEESAISSPAVMTLAEADRIIDIVLEALQADDDIPFHPVSRLQGYDLLQFVAAVKLRLASMSLALAETGAPSERFDEEVTFWESGPFNSFSSLFIPDIEFHKLRHLPRDSKEYYDTVMLLKCSTSDERFLELETISSFAEYCRFVDPSDPLFWEKIYDRIGLPYSGMISKGNQPACQLICN